MTWVWTRTCRRVQGTETLGSARRQVKGFPKTILIVSHALQTRSNSDSDKKHKPERVDQAPVSNAQAVQLE